MNPSNLICIEKFGVDPGASNGSVTKLTDSKLQSWNMDKMADFETMLQFWRDQKDQCKQPLVILENITTFTADADNIGRMYRMQKLKEHYSDIRCCLKAAKVPYIEVMPLEWMRYLGVYIKGEDRNIRKKRFKDISADHWPQIKVTLKNADSLLLVEFLLKKLKYDPLWLISKIKEHNKKQEKRLLFK